MHTKGREETRNATQDEDNQTLRLEMTKPGIEQNM